MSKSIHNRAYKYTNEFISHDGKKTVITSVIALVPGSKSIDELIQYWNNQPSKCKYTLLGEIPVKEALYTKGLRGGMIATDWKLLDTMPYHSVEISVDVIDPVL